MVVLAMYTANLAAFLTSEFIVRFNIDDMNLHLFLPFYLNYIG